MYIHPSLYRTDSQISDMNEAIMRCSFNYSSVFVQFTLRALRSELSTFYYNGSGVIVNVSTIKKLEKKREFQSGSVFF